MDRAWVLIMDERDTRLKDMRIAALDLIKGPRVGDFCIFPDGTVTRFTHDWGDSIQTMSLNFAGSFYLGYGYVSYSGGLDPSIPKSKIKELDEKRDGSFWLFHHDHHIAHNDISFLAPCRVYKIED